MRPPTLATRRCRPRWSEGIDRTPLGPPEPSMGCGGSTPPPSRRHALPAGDDPPRVSRSQSGCAARGRPPRPTAATRGRGPASWSATRKARPGGRPRTAPSAALRSSSGSNAADDDVVTSTSRGGVTPHTASSVNSPSTSQSTAACRAASRLASARSTPTRTRLKTPRPPVSGAARMAANVPARRPSSSTVFSPCAARVPSAVSRRTHPLELLSIRQTAAPQPAGTLTVAGSHLRARGSSPLSPTGAQRWHRHERSWQLAPERRKRHAAQLQGTPTLASRRGPGGRALGP